MTIEEKQNALIAAANAVTGESDVNITAVIQRLIDGYGQGGLPTGINELNSGTFSVTSTGNIDIPHGMDQPPTHVCLYPTNFIDDTDNSLKLMCATESSTNILGRRSVESGTSWRGGSYDVGIEATETAIHFASQSWSYAHLQPTNGGVAIVYRWVAWR